MASILNVDQINNAAGTSGIALDASTGKPSFPNGANLPAGSVLQVVQGSTSVQVNTTSATFTDTGLSVSITPSSASSKVFVMAVHQGCGKYGANNSLALNLLRDSTQIHTGGTKGVNSNDTGESWVGSYTLSYLDSPSTTSAVTYKTQLSNVTGSGTVRVQSSDGVSTIVAMEIAG